MAMSGIWKFCLVGGYLTCHKFEGNGYKLDKEGFEYLHQHIMLICTVAPSFKGLETTSQSLALEGTDRINLQYCTEPVRTIPIKKHILEI